MAFALLIMCDLFELGSQLGLSKCVPESYLDGAFRFANTHEGKYSTPGFEHAHSLALSIKRSTTTLPRTQLSQTIEAKSRQSTPPEDPIYVG
jgi:hypothetical protein